ncbi:uncharacterized protein OCT59_015294 [Rhizophagus irregularis]|uniref:uncharacterized protein n=1 Tax=Rhizophagus irregularis TaxID=588596 RepID=UPI003321CD2C|nr:hypothetical protein OCT59_015294 [Rhizophagus irregularis]
MAESCHNRSYYETAIRNEEFGPCNKCRKPKTDDDWCQSCCSDRFELDSGFSTINKAIWLDGYIICWNDIKNVWNRNRYKLEEEDYLDYRTLKEDEKFGFHVVLKSLNNINEDFLNEWENYLEFLYSAINNYANFVRVFGITQDPKTKVYMVVLEEMKRGSLRDNLLIKKYNPNDKYHNLYEIACSLSALSKPRHRPEIIEGTEPDYVELMKRCWDNDPNKRPTAKELSEIFDVWSAKYLMEMDYDKRKSVPVPTIIENHPLSCYISRKIDHYAKLNEILDQGELSSIIVIDEGKDDEGKYNIESELEELKI